MSKIEQIKIPVEIEIPEESKIWKLKKSNYDLFEKSSSDIIWIEWDDNGKVLKRHKKIKLGTSLLMSPFNMFFTWQTTVVTKIIKNTKNHIIFETKNSSYILKKIEN